MILSKNMEQLVAGSSTIRRLFEDGLEMAEKVGKENVYDFSLGNPAAPVPEKVRQVLSRILDEEDPNYVHCYMPNAGYPIVRRRVAEFLSREHGVHYDMEDIIMTVGAAGGMNCVFRSLLEEGDEVICFAPYFGEYRSYVMNYGGVLRVVPADLDTLQLNTAALEENLTPKTRAVIINNPNNPSGVIYTRETLERLQPVLRSAEKKYGRPIYVIADEPYRDLVYDDRELVYLPELVKNCIFIYSFSKSLSLSGERIGYMAVSKQVDCYDELINALVVANRCIGYINAPSLFQLVVSECLEEPADLAFYDRNRKLLYESLTRMGFTCIRPEGAFYMLVKAPEGDEQAFADKAKKYNIILVPTTTFGCPGYVRLAYCVSHQMAEKSLKAFEKLAENYFKI